MNILNELLLLSEAKGKNLIGLTIGGKLITKKTSSEPWPGNFKSSVNQLTSLEGAPSSVGGYFWCSYNQLTSLEGAPSSVGGNFRCFNNQLTSLKGAPTSVGGDFRCYDNQLISLKGAPASVGGDFNCYNNKLTTLEGAPSSVGGYFNCSFNQLTTLEGAPSSVGDDFGCSVNQLTSLTGIHKILKQMNGNFYANGNPLKSNVIGLLLVKGCKKVELDNKQVMEIMNRHLQSPFGHLRVLECQSEMLDAVLEEWAEL